MQRFKKTLTLIGVFCWYRVPLPSPFFCCLVKTLLLPWMTIY